MNFIVFVPEQMRAESIGCYGHPLVRTPHIDGLAAQAVRFDQAYVQHSVCTPSRCSFMTGWYPHVRGHRTLWHMLRPDEPNLLKYLKQAGYEVVCYGKNDLLARESFADSVDEFTCPRGLSKDANGPVISKGAPPGYLNFHYAPTEGTLDDLTDMACVQRGIEFLTRPHEKPFMLYLPLPQMSHPPFSAPQRYYDMYDPAEIPQLRPPDLPGKADFHQLIRRYRRLDEMDDQAMRKLNAIYLGMISCVDDMLGRLMATLEQTGLDDDTTVLFFGDHGEWAGDYGLVEKWPSALDDCVTRVPLIVRYPKGAAGHVVAEPVEIMDVMATVLELAGVEAGHSHFSRSLVPQLTGAAGEAERAVFAEGGYDAHEPHCFEGRDTGEVAWRDPTQLYYVKGKQQQDHPASVCRATMIRTASAKLIRRTAGVGELYDLRRDPRELRNVYDESKYAPLRTELEKRMLDWLIRTSDVAPFDEDPR